MSGHLDGPPPGPPDPPYIPGDLGAPSAKEFARRRAGLLRPAVAPAASPDERLREALELIRAHARLDLTERGIAEAERYAAIADDALTARDQETER